ncbi:MAG: PilZ domain-containing protein [SAR324 cluster bacterium]|nr:PilZ domain-containing protein [SAR324 cluster bacterium]
MNMSKEGQSALEQDETRYQGRYIPYGGGCAGWFRNLGVPNNELGNNYGFYTAIDVEMVLQKRFERLGQDVNRRQANRQLVDGNTPVTLTWERHQVDAIMKDFSDKGIRVRLTEDPGLKSGDLLGVRVHPSEFFKNELAILDCQVRWIKQVRTDGGAWHIGIAYAGL